MSFDEGEGIVWFGKGGKAVSPLAPFDKGGKYCGVSLYAVVMNRRNIRRGVGLPLPKYHCNYQKQVNRIIM